MCIICNQFNEGKLTVGEAVRNYGEIKETLSEEHQKEMEEKLFNNFSFYPNSFDNYDFGRGFDDVGSDDEYWEEIGFGD
jgi:hypothetical protein|tara:strand:- start:612 stop:848 length:237 start_codon:yes stop_codon:yes gene_type:complete